MKLSSLQSRASFQVKVLVPVIAVLVVLTAVTIGLVTRHIGEQLDENAADRLQTADKVFKKIQDVRRENLLSKYRNVINEPRVRAVTKDSNFATLKVFINDLLGEVVEQNEATIATFTFFKSGKAQSISTNNAQLDAVEFQAQSGEAVRQALDGRPKMDTVRVGTNLLDIVSIPIGGDFETAGVLTFGVKIGTEAATEIRQITRSEIVFLTAGQVAASSLNKPDLYPSLVARFDESSSPEKRDARSNPEIILDHEHYLCQPGHFTSLSGDTRMGYLLLSSYEGPLAEFKATREKLLIIGLLGIVFSVVVICILVRQVTRPLRQLRDNVEAVGRGDFSQRVEISADDECGQLATAFNEMTENIKTSREELEKTVETLKATQHQLIQSEKLSGIGEFVAGVAHELNNPLTSVMGFSELLQQGDMPEQQRRYLDVIFKSAKRCTKIVQSLLSFARRHAPERKVVSVNEIVESAVEILHYQMRTSNIEVFTQLDPQLPLTEIDPHQMQQVFLNLINNARQAIEGHQKQGWLRITTESSAGQVRVIFKDNGPGISPENLKRIFNPFFTTKEVGKGTGLGLSLCYGIVSEHGGSITPYSKPDDGATFVIELPTAAKAPTPVDKIAAKGPEASKQEGVGKRVLVIDDEDLILQMIREVLTGNGYKVDVALDGESALRRMSQYHYDLALCDWKMPGLNGQQLYERLNQFNPEMSKRLIFITGDVVNEKVQEFLSSQNKVCLSKPFTLIEFRSAINRVITPAATS